MKLSFNILKLLLVSVILWAQVPAFADVSELRDSFTALDNRAQKKWNKLVELQEDSEWVETQSDLGPYGSIFHKGWVNPKVERRIVPDRDSGLLVIDSVSLGATLLTQAATLSANFLISSYLPIVQGGPISEKSFTNVRKVENYEEALLAKHFELKKIPLTGDDFSFVEPGEIFTTVSTSGFFTRHSLLMLDLLEVAIPAIDIGPKAKLHIQKSVKVTISKESETTAIISLENITEKGFGVGTGLGIFLEDLITLPISIGISGQEGYTPVVFNFKKNKQKVTHLIFKVDISKEDGVLAYQQFLQSDFTMLQDLAAQKNSSVSLTMQKEGEIRTKEISFGVNLVLWRSGFRNIEKNGKFQSTLADGTLYRYEEAQVLKIRDRLGFSGKEKEIFQISTIVPVDKENAGFVLDSKFFYHDSKTRGSELIKISKRLKSLGFPTGLPVIPNKKHKYGETQIETQIRFSAFAMKQVLSVDDATLWEAIATSMGQVNPLIWVSSQSNDSKALMIFKMFNKFKKSSELKEKAASIVNSLKSKKYGALFHKTMINIVGLNQIMGQGYIRGL